MSGTDVAHNLDLEFLRARVKVLLGGRAAEEAVLGSVSTGAADDLSKVTQLARKMVSEWGMSEAFRHLAFQQDGGQEVFLGEQLTRQRPYSEETAREIDLEIKSLVADCYKEALELLEKHRDRLKRIADALEEEETLEGDELKRCLEGDEGENGPASEESTAAAHSQAAERS